MTRVVSAASRLYDRYDAIWRSVRAQRTVGTSLVVLFLGAILAIELNRRGWLPEPASSLLPTNHFGAVDLAFTLLIILEVLGLVFALAGSVAVSVGKQFELLSLIFLRKAFLEFGSFGEPIEWSEISVSILHVVSDTVGALLVFALVGLFYRLQRHEPFTEDEADLTQFIAAKKLVAVVLLGAFVALGAHYLWTVIGGGAAYRFFEAFYVILIFSDILIVLIAQRYSSSYVVVFRNSGFAVSTVLMRLALTAPPYINAMLGVGAALFALGLTVAYNSFARVMAERGR